jgi:branched-chain amino acid transport system substrate-binding protein
MRFIARAAIFLLTLASAQPLLAQGQPIKITGVVELSGAGATSGTNFNDGVKLAVKEINAAGGILGRRVDYTAATRSRSRRWRRRSRSRPSTTSATS